ncbi:Catalase [Rubellimicrobium mesophilum DSM 19309]|uniref:Catalase n=1 Tax=Rubellimicrobium mesophilum DSM 19309 TaxID=442562 RepID=A0A017HV56_9RHOB|nr:catalase family protein [Rubellimicrobium mesophilum]EYD78276.1 Catalase [Rubellimicrobium mesophilum DSM 19309]
MKDPIRYTLDLERPEADEADTVAGLEEALREIMETTAKDLGHAIRSVHAKSHALIVGTLSVLPGLPPELAQGLFARAGEHPALLRISTNPGDLLPDRVSLPRGAALKVLEVEGARLHGSEDEATQDFLLVNGPAFAARSAKQFLGNLRMLAKTTDRAEWAKVALSAVLRTAEKGLEAVGGESATLKTLGGAANVHPLGETYFSQTAFRHGDFVAKYSLAPVSPALTRHAGEEIAIEGRDTIREVMDRDTREGVMEWELRAQLCRDPETMPVEDPTVVWDEAESPFVAVARLRAEPQGSWNPERAARVDDPMRFSPWTGLEAHRPLGAINRVRKPVYEASAAFRSRVNGCPVHEPSVGELPGAVAV